MFKQVYIALGTNLGNKKLNIRRATTSIKQIKHIYITKISRFYKTIPEGNPHQPNFINAVVEIKTSLTPIQLLNKLLKVEKNMGRMRKKMAKRSQPRIIDLDILLYESTVHRSRGLIIPHPSMHKRRFALEPLCEIAPTLKHPLLNKPVNELLGKLIILPRNYINSYAITS
ncbi:MAG: 2-amino-4-hydroxy-6-hydroxymethyldihydropteridine diphosphokinase [Planctomycetota bacterium]|nr:2-amino-4-hydroxy-6-hydroxymethyldihydropteridine diphosphokinase [Planctomycetota bacterium]MDI6787323.1 2-amino-4-hydroxy-6-hydroxymethyldihydropteridine diphosphokinase [Planctomycetota bacterium]